MGKNVVVITGSPRKGGNSDILAEAFIEEAEKKGHKVQRFDSGRLKIGPCHACNNCFKKGKPCVFDDDFNAIATAVQAADAVVFSMPTYWFSAPSNIKAVLDRMYSFLASGKIADIAGKKAAILACCMSEDPAIMDDVKSPFIKSFAFLKWDCIGEVSVPKVANPGDVKNTDGCKQAAALADLV
ncbi:MAG: flavodoxin family protein [Selenomonadaceae bacterium]|nr:flavodoxin family protein [Selenomonadaceae bacterium]